MGRVIVEYRHTTKRGTFRLVRNGAYWQPWLDDEPIPARERNVQSLLEFLTGGHTDWPSCGDPSLLGLSDRLDDWEALYR